MRVRMRKWLSLPSDEIDKKSCEEDKKRLLISANLLLETLCSKKREVRRLCQNVGTTL